MRSLLTTYGEPDKGVMVATPPFSQFSAEYFPGHTIDDDSYFLAFLGECSMPVNGRLLIAMMFRQWACKVGVYLLHLCRA